LLNSLWNALHSSFNNVLDHQVNISVLDKIGNKLISSWFLFLKEEFKIAINSCNNSSTPGLDKLSWNHLKSVLKHEDCLANIIGIANTCINLGYWPNHFKKSTTIIIPKPNKLSYNSPKSFRLIVLLNMLGKLIKKVIRERIQFHIAANDFIYPSQLGRLKFKSTTDARVTLTHIIRLGWSKNLPTSTLAFDILQFFPLLNHCLLTKIIHKASLNNCVIDFFSNYLIDRKTNYSWNNFSSSIFHVNISIGQGLALSPILLALYLLLFLYILEKRLKNLKIPISIISFVDDGLFISQDKSLEVSNACLFYSYNVMSNLLDKFGLVAEHLKTEIFHFSRMHGLFNPPPLDFSSLGGPILSPKNSWKYLSFIFNRKLTFHQHIDFYSNRAISSVKCMKLLGNSSCSISPLQKRLLYKCCILSIALYSFQLWFYNHVPLLYPFKTLNKIQRRAAIWILDAFKTSLTEGVEALTGLISIKSHVQKLGRRSQLRAISLPLNHIIRSLMDFPIIINIHPLSAPSQIVKKQKSKGILPMLTTDHIEFLLPFSSPP